MLIIADVARAANSLNATSGVVLRNSGADTRRLGLDFMKGFITRFADCAKLEVLVVGERADRRMYGKI